RKTQPLRRQQLRKSRSQETEARSQNEKLEPFFFGSSFLLTPDSWILTPALQLLLSVFVRRCVTGRRAEVGEFTEARHPAFNFGGVSLRVRDRLVAADGAGGEADLLVL